MILASPPRLGSARSGKTRSRPTIAARQIQRVLPRLHAGRLQIVLPGGETIVRRGAGAGAEARLVLHRWRALARMLIDRDHGFSEGYLDGDWSAPELDQLLTLLMQNEDVLMARELQPFGNLCRRLSHWLRANTRRASRRNISVHYDLGNEFFQLWLDRGMNYSSALYAAGDTLESAQERKLDRVAALLDLAGGEHVLEIGCGWGALVERLVKRHGANVAGITLSGRQLAYAQSRLAGAIVRGRGDLRLLDYRDIEGQYDRIASIEMIEAVGERYWPAYFTKLRGALRPGGIILLQAITIAEQRFAAYRKRPDFIQRHIFPGGMLPTRSIVEYEAARAGLKLVHRESFGASYAATLREWRTRFLHAWPEIKQLGFDDRFRRLWEYYLAYCETGFRFDVLDVSLFKFVLPTERCWSG